MNLSETLKYYGKQVRVTCTDGEEYRAGTTGTKRRRIARRAQCHRHRGAGIITEIPIDEVASIAAL